MTTAKYEMTTAKYAWSDDEVVYHGSFDSHDEALDDATNNYPDGECPKFFYTGKIIDTRERLLKEALPYLVDRMGYGVEDIRRWRQVVKHEEIVSSDL